MMKNNEMTMEELERKMMQEMYKELKRDNIPSVDGEIYLSDGVTLTASGDVVEQQHTEFKKGALKKILNDSKGC
jgi:hypothetical protein